MQDFKRLTVWQKAHRLLLLVHETFDSRRIARAPWLRGQILRSAGSIAANIAEGCGKRSTKEFIRFLDIAIGSTRELENHLLVARDLRIITATRFDHLDALLTEVRRMLIALLRALEKQAPRHNARTHSGLQSPISGLGSSVGFTIVELLLVLTIAGIILAIAIPRGLKTLDRITVTSAASDIHATLNFARSLALAGGRAVAIDVDSVTGTVRVRRDAEIVLSRNVGHAHGVALRASRDSMTYDPRGLGRGAANLSIIVRRGTAVESVFVSRMGRVR